MTNQPWTGEEINLIVNDYFSMLVAEINGKPFNKTGHRQKLQPQLNNRTKGAIEFKLRNISAVLCLYNHVYIVGYKPAINFQSELQRRVLHWLNTNPILEVSDTLLTEQKISNNVSLLTIIDPPTRRNVLIPNQINELRNYRKDCDYVNRELRNKQLGQAGEKLIYLHEKNNLIHSGQAELANQVCWVSKEYGDGLGYDIKSYTPDGRNRFIEVKTTNGWQYTPFYITSNELDIANQYENEWSLMRVFHYLQQPTVFEIFPPLTEQVNLHPTNYRAEIA